MIQENRKQCFLLLNQKEKNNYFDQKIDNLKNKLKEKYRKQLNNQQSK